MNSAKDAPLSTKLDNAVSVIIVGAGPSGLAAANLLGLYGIETLLLERHDGLSTYPKAITIDDEGLRICQAMGLAEAVLADTLSDLEVHYLAGKQYLAHVKPRSHRNGYSLISTFYQPAFEAALLQGLTRFPHVTVLFGHSVEAFAQNGQGLQVHVRAPDGTRLHIPCTYLLACDGGKSMLRQALGISLLPLSWLLPAGLPSADRGHKKRPYGQRWLVVDCHNDEDSSPTAIFFCNPSRPTVTLAAPHGHRRWEFMLLKGEREEDLLQDDNIYALIKQARMQQKEVTHVEYSSPPQIMRSAVYTFHSALANSFVRGNVFLLGDAAHLMPPFSGQGMNSGLRDAHNLCWKLQAVLQGQASSRLLTSYQQERKPHAAQMIRFSAILGKLIMPTSHSLAFLRDTFLRNVQHIAPLRHSITEMRVKPAPRYAQGFLLPAKGRYSRHITGQLLPQPYVLLPEGRRVLCDEVLGPGFALLRLYENPSEAFSHFTHAIWQGLIVRFVCVMPLDTPPDRLTNMQKEHEKTMPIIDIEGKLAEFLGQQHNLCVLVRPDRYVMGAFASEDADRYAQLSGQLLQTK
ncbi:bifunctional 3-(3-hydroxy-phenyl)propionate/3-hydroxycinnamic acid hydroxylase [Ktedonosporobacter rubrisoli]|uniref:Bifunctional 3-(3-hydroxy-phenyl)propionate/3-hydroxycinnamic acid hydroxylase n=1 Tax=Ktedonosporobacter rubrisoli TaxID=2509675 RepID=A0A4P6K0I5_KTERU|nr:bifunctional 3-(3-hydroxy-phenyl)propionate/3-hydroxycinnamic acid hydroxylase [Ktedonosporobacter rubrisoli]QBD81559.1 bifunctional 3-(3-hydroxy-phenyl)propionate/3-hydroxycinnamic acid hydroxylase [Ktedonosporobacter rubrisoli]